MFVSSGLNFKLRDDLHMNSAICGFESFFIIMADFNIDLLTTDTNHQTADLIHNMFTHMFCPKSVSPPGSQTIQRRLLII